MSYAILHGIEPLAREVRGRAVGEMTPRSKGHAQHSVPRRAKRQHHSLVRLSARMPAPRDTVKSRHVCSYGTSCVLERHVPCVLCVVMVCGEPPAHQILTVARMQGLGRAQGLSASSFSSTATGEELEGRREEGYGCTLAQEQLKSSFTRASANRSAASTYVRSDASEPREE